MISSVPPKAHHVHHTQMSAHKALCLPTCTGSHDSGGAEQRGGLAADLLQRLERQPMVLAAGTTRRPCAHSAPTNASREPSDAPPRFVLRASCNPVVCTRSHAAECCHASAAQLSTMPCCPFIAQDSDAEWMFTQARGFVGVTVIATLLLGFCYNICRQVLDCDRGCSGGGDRRNPCAPPSLTCAFIRGSSSLTCALKLKEGDLREISPYHSFRSRNHPFLHAHRRVLAARATIRPPPPRPRGRGCRRRKSRTPRVMMTRTTQRKWRRWCVVAAFVLWLALLTPLPFWVFSFYTMDPPHSQLHHNELHYHHTTTAMGSSAKPHSAS